jgi:hypothetical protein
MVFKFDTGVTQAVPHHFAKRQLGFATVHSTDYAFNF